MLETELGTTFDGRTERVEGKRRDECEPARYQRVNKVDVARRRVRG
jgi:hypothetical protein